MTFDVAAVFAEEFDAAISEEEASSGFPVKHWQPTGRKGGIAADIAWWHEQGPVMVQNYIDWFESTPGAGVWTTPAGTLAVELELSVTFGKVPVKVKIDVVHQLGSALVVTDLKSSATKPEALTQLGIYASAIELVYGIRPRYGNYFMARGYGRKAEDRKYFLQPVELSGYQYSIPYLTGQFETLDRAVRDGIFLANPGEHCGRCGVAASCPVITGRQATK